MGSFLKLFKSMIIVGLGLVMATKVNAAAYRGPITTEGLNLIKGFETFRPNFYTDSVGITTIGYGYACHINSCDKIRSPITETEAIVLLKTQVKPFETCVNQNVKYAYLNAAQFSAFVSFTLNMGCANLKGSTLLSKLNKNDVVGAAAEFAKWNKANGGTVLPVLTKRRKAERTLFCCNNAC